MRTSCRLLLLLTAGLLVAGPAVSGPAYMKLGDVKGESARTEPTERPAARVQGKPAPASPARKVAPRQLPSKGNVEYEWKLEEGES